MAKNHAALSEFAIAEMHAAMRWSIFLYQDLLIYIFQVCAFIKIF